MTTTTREPLDHIARQAETIAAGLEKLITEAGQLAPGEDDLERMVMIDTFTAEAIVQTVRACPS